MSFQPLSNRGLSESLVGVADPAKFTDPFRNESREIHAGLPKGDTLKYTLIIVIISAIIFVTVIAIYDIIRNYINNKYAKISLENPDSGNTPQQIQSTLIANSNQLISSFVFALICIILALILIPILITFIK